MKRPYFLNALLGHSSSLRTMVATAAGLCAMAVLGGCHIEHHNGEDIDFDTSSKFEVCGAFCTQLLDCGDIGAVDFGACYSTCSSQFDKNETKVRNGCSCAVKATCSSVSSKTCSGAPFPSGVGEASSGTDAGPSTSVDTSTSADTSSPAVDTTQPSDSGSSGGGGSTGVQTSGTVSTCKINQDCESNQDCISGYCLERCKASCECATGQSCLNGYCSIAIAQDKPCTVDCECPSGSKCTSGFCN